MKTLLYGGTFNPVHIGHIRLAQNAKNLLCPDRMLLIPSFIPPHKETDFLASAEDRLTMTHLAAMQIGCSVSDTELRRGERSYSVDTLETLKQDGFGDLYFLMGSDMFLSLETWHEWQRILTLCTPVAAARKKDELPSLYAHAERLKRLYNADSIVCDFAVTDISSTELRQKLAAGEDVKDFIPADILSYLTLRGLYKTGG